MPVSEPNPLQAAPVDDDLQATPTRVLLVDDDPKLCRLISTYLEPLGFEVNAVQTGPDGLKQARAQEPDVVILDVMLPGMDGFAVLKKLRQSSDVPVLMLTGRGEESDRVHGLELGADDYLPKTFSTRELLARLRAVLRRAQRTATGEAPLTEWINGPLRMQAESRTVTLNDETLELTALEFDLLASLIRVPGRVRSREQLLNDVAGREYEVFDRSIDVHISALRQKLGDNPKHPEFIRTVRSVGYMMIRR